MSKTITIQLSDAEYEAVRAVAARAGQTMEALVAAAIAERLGTDSQAAEQGARPAQDPLIQFMRERGHLVDPRTMPPPPEFPGMPAYGTPEWDRWVEEMEEEEAGDEFDFTGVNLADFVER
jgi:CubicO group peptidase (beta-lactamase class C family)